eukprot:COSAG02_NODE_3546_length_6583_cov_2.799661_5_plen_222_part_00
MPRGPRATVTVRVAWLLFVDWASHRWDTSVFFGMAPHADQDAECAICSTVAASGPDTIWEDSRWLCAHCSPAPLPGWLMFYSQRHVQGPAKFNSDEAANFGLAVRHIEQKLEELTGALRIYTVAFGESTAHLHAHLIPRYDGLAPGASEDKLFEGYAFGIAGKQRSDPPLTPRVRPPWHNRPGSCVTMPHAPDCLRNCRSCKGRHGPASRRWRAVSRCGRC